MELTITKEQVRIGHKTSPLQRFSTMKTEYTGRHNLSMWRHPVWILLLFLIPAAVNSQPLQPLKISSNKRFFMTADGKPFFWLGDTGWLLFGKLTREETEQYLEDRRRKGFNVIQVMVLHTLGLVDVYGDSALINRNVATPKVTPGAAFSNSSQYDYWDHVDYVVDLARKKGLYLAMVPVWGSNVKEGGVTEAQARIYASFLAKRYRNKSNIIWMNGGDIPGSDSMNIWKAIGETLYKEDPAHLITFHPRGRTPSSEWFHKESWLAFNMFQSGHRRYEQDTSAGEKYHYGEDNWKFIEADYQLKPVKPTLDGEPSYEGIPQGLHDTTQPRWKDKDVRRYGYWSVFAGAAGYTYGDNAVMQMHKPTDKTSAYGSNTMWYDAINDPGAGQMKYLKQLLLSRPYFERVPDQSLIAEGQEEKYNYLVATRGKSYAFIYNYTGRAMKIATGKITGNKITATWYSPVNGKKTPAGTYDNKGVLSFTPPGGEKEGNDWVLILDGKS